MSPRSLLFTLGAALPLFAGCAKKNAGTPPAAPKIVVQLDWVAEPEHGGFYQAEGRGFFKAEGLDVEIRQGGPNVYPLQMVALGQAQFAQADSTGVLAAIQQGLPLINVASVFHHDPTVFMMHADNPVTQWRDLNGKTIMARPQYEFLPYLKKKYGINFQVIPQNFGLGQFLADKDFIQQGYYIAEPFYLEKAGAKVKWLYVWNTGFDAYTVIVANKNWVAAHPELTRKFLAAYVRGARDYIEGDPAPAHALMEKINPKAKENLAEFRAFLAFSRGQIIRQHLMGGDAAQGESFGTLSAARFAIEIRQQEELGVLKPGLTPAQVMTDAYLPQNGARGGR